MAATKPNQPVDLELKKVKCACVLVLFKPNAKPECLPFELLQLI